MIRKTMITAAQSRAARALLNISQDELSKKAEVGVATIRTFETGKAQTRRSVIKALRGALEELGITFVPENGEGAGVRLRKGHQPLPPAPATSA
jgi:ribosome-binding protein aMBF1 (putative translation factor)